GNRPPLTGIRAFVIGCILVYHSNFHTFPGAWAAISVFFVLSGFLITSMLLAEHQRDDRISLRRFYTRRALRLLPFGLGAGAVLGLPRPGVVALDRGAVLRDLVAPDAGSTRHGQAFRRLR